MRYTHAHDCKNDLASSRLETQTSLWYMWMYGSELIAGKKLGHVAHESFCTHVPMIIPCSLPYNLSLTCFYTLGPDSEPRRQVHTCIMAQTQL